MQFIAYVLIYPFLWVISILPFPVLYAFSDAVYVLLYHIIGYRKKVVVNNIKLVFPEKTDQEIKQITKKFYHHMCDLFLEMIKSRAISRSQIRKRFVVKNPEVLEALDKKDQSVVFMYGHFASYEWSISLQEETSTKGLGIYKSLANVYFDKLVRNIRSKYNSELVDTKHAIKRIDQLHKEGVKSWIAFLSDQSPKLKPSNYWGTFMGIHIPCFTGAEITAKKYNYPVAYFKIEKVSRGHYETEVIILAENPQDYPDFEITEKFNRILESQIKRAPEFYLWTHKRWKHKDEIPGQIPSFHH